MRTEEEEVKTVEEEDKEDVAIFYFAVCLGLLLFLLLFLLFLFLLFPSVFCYFL